MLAKIEMEIEGNGLDVNMSSLFHGYLMNSIDSAYADYLHYNETHPYTSCIYKNMESGKIFWKITTFNKNAYEMLIKYFLENDIKNIYLEKKGIEVFVKSVSMKKTSFDELFFNDEKKSKIYFLTPTTHKSNGILQIFPNISTLLLGVINKINQHSDTIKLEDENVINELLEKVYIDEYYLRTRYFFLENIRVRGFIGNLKIKIKGKDEMLYQLLNFLLKVSEYTGLGVKTALGMGGIKIG